MLIVNILGVSLIALIIWWFWLFKPKEVAVLDDKITVLVENGTYQPARIKLPVGHATVIQFMRKDASPCSSMVLIPDLEISQELPMNKLVSIELPAMQKGEFAFHCQMQMYKGTFLVE